MYFLSPQVLAAALVGAGTLGAFPPFAFFFLVVLTANRRVCQPGAVVRGRFKHRQHDREDGQLRRPLQEASRPPETVGRLHAAQVSQPFAAKSASPKYHAGLTIRQPNPTEVDAGKSFSTSRREHKSRFDHCAQLFVASHKHESERPVV